MTSFAVDIQGTVGADTAWIGFTGSTGGGTSDQVLSNFHYNVVPEPSSALLLGAALLPLARRRR
ncbi:MAG: PEP-CTERM sorting domain-containing protein, partial [Planctomycetota bacterium]